MNLRELMNTTVERDVIGVETEIGEFTFGRVTVAEDEMISTGFMEIFGDKRVERISTSEEEEGKIDLVLAKRRAKDEMEGLI